MKLLSESDSVLHIGEPHARFHIVVLTCMAGTHRAGLHAVNQLIQESFFDSIDKAARVTLVLGNPEATRLRRRFVHKDLNTLIDSTAHFGGECYEADRARLIARHVATCDLLLDLQSFDDPDEVALGDAAATTAASFDGGDLEFNQWDATEQPSRTAPRHDNHNSGGHDGDAGDDGHAADDHSFSSSESDEEAGLDDSDDSPRDDGDDDGRVGARHHRPSVALPATNKKSEFIARWLPVDFSITKLAHRTQHRSSAVDWAYFRGKAAVQVVVGAERHRRSILVAKHVVRAVLAGECIRQPRKHLVAMDSIIAKNRFRYINRLAKLDDHDDDHDDQHCHRAKPLRSSFEFVRFGECVAHDEANGDITCPHADGAYMVNVNPHPDEFDLAFVWCIKDHSSIETQAEESDSLPRGSPVIRSPYFRRPISTSSSGSGSSGSFPVSCGTLIGASSSSSSSNSSNSSSNNLLGLSLSRSLPRSPDTALTASVPCLVFGSRSARLHVLITVAIHGNEHCGVAAVNELIRDGFFSEVEAKGAMQVTVLLGNPPAFLANKRFIDENLNRVISPYLMEGESWESKRATVIADAIKNCHVYLDLHSCSAATPPFALPCKNNKSERLAQELPVTYVIKGLAHTTPGRGTSLDWAYFHGKTAVTVECGEHNSPDSVRTAKHVIHAFITGQYRQLVPPSHIMECNRAEVVRPHFSFHRHVEAFEHVPFNELLAHDERGEIRCPYADGAYIVMPAALPVLGEEAWFWGVATANQPASGGAAAAPRTADSDVSPSQTAGEPATAADDASVPRLPLFEPPLFTTLSRYRASRLTPDSPVLSFGPKNATLQVLFLCAMDGDDRCGLEAVNQLLADGHVFDNKELAIRVTVAIGNPEAVAQQRRFIDERLNRCIGATTATQRGHSYESHRAQFLSRLIEDHQVLVTFHSTSYATPSLAIAAANDASLELARSLPVRYLMRNVCTKSGMTTLDWAYMYQKTAASVVCGAENDAASLQVAIDVIRAVVAGHSPATHIEREFLCTGFELLKPGARVAKAFAPFEYVPYGARVILGATDADDVQCKYENGAYIVLPAAEPKAGEEAWFWAVQEAYDPFDVATANSTSTATDHVPVT